LHKITILGGYGYMGSEAVCWLAKHTDAEIVIAGRNEEKAKELAVEVQGNTCTQSVDVEDSRSLNKAMKDTDIVLSTVGPFYKYGATILKAAIRAGVDFLDINDDYDSSRDSLDLSNEAQKAGVTAIIGAGASPGVTNVLAKYGTEKLDRVDEINTLWCESATDPTGSAAMTHWIHIISGSIPTYRNGRWVDVPGLSEPEIVDFPVFGKAEVAYVGHAEPVTIPRFIENVQVVTNKGGLLPSSAMTFYRTMMDLGFGSDKEFRVREGVYVPMNELGVKIMRAMPHFAPETFQRLVNGSPKLGIALKVNVTGEADGRKTRLSYGCAADVRLLTSIPLSIAAIMVLNGDIRVKGVFAPEGAINTVEFLKELTKAGIEIYETGERKIQL
jgi:saccharopine dehydrogenase-like NADP-dependent oxidoreductase